MVNEHGPCPGLVSIVSEPAGVRDRVLSMLCPLCSCFIFVQRPSARPNRYGRLVRLEDRFTRIGMPFSPQRSLLEEIDSTGYCFRTVRVIIV
jgi:hypothetical protein